MENSTRTKQLLILVASVLLIGGAAAFIDGQGAQARPGITQTDPAGRDAYGVTVHAQQVSETPWEDSSLLKQARLRADLRDMIYAR